MSEALAPPLRLTVLVTRPRPQAMATARELHRLGHRALIDPLLSVQAVPFAPLDPAGAACLLLTSANAVVAFEPRLAGLPVMAVGPATAAAASRRGFTDVTPAEGDAAALARLVQRRFTPADGPVLHASGEETGGELARTLGEAGYDYRRTVVYRAATATHLASRTARALHEGLDAVLLFSPRTAHTFAELVQAAGAAPRLREITACCLSQDVADRVAELPWRAVHVAERRSQDALIACVQRLAEAL